MPETTVRVNGVGKLRNTQHAGAVPWNYVYTRAHASSFRAEHAAAIVHAYDSLVRPLFPLSGRIPKRVNARFTTLLSILLSTCLSSPRPVRFLIISPLFDFFVRRCMCFVRVLDTFVYRGRRRKKTRTCSASKNLGSKAQISFARSVKWKIGKSVSRNIARRIQDARWRTCLSRMRGTHAKNKSPNESLCRVAHCRASNYC